MTTPITVKNEVGRPVNPFTMSSAVPMVGMNSFESYHEFEDKVTPYPCPGIPDTKEGESIEAELMWQYLHPVRQDWNTIMDSSGDWERTHKIRQIYLIPQQPKEQEKEKTAESFLREQIGYAGSGNTVIPAIHFNDIVKVIEAYATQQTTIKDTRISELENTLNEQCAAYDKLVEELDNKIVAKDARISELEARGKEDELAEIDVTSKIITAYITRIFELESRVRELSGVLKKMVDNPHMAGYECVEIATNAIKANKDGK